MICLTWKTGKVGGVAVVTEVIAERALETPLSRRYEALQDETRRRPETSRSIVLQRTTLHGARRINPEKAISSMPSGNAVTAAIRRQGSAPMTTATSSGTPQPLGHVVVKSATLVDLPVNSGGLRVVDLYAVDADVALTRQRILGYHEAEGDTNGPPSPGQQVWTGNRDRSGNIDDLLYGGRAHPTSPHAPKHVADGAALLPQPPRLRRLGSLGEPQE